MFVISLPGDLKAKVIPVPVYTPAAVTQLIHAPSFTQAAPAIWASKSITDDVVLFGCFGVFFL